MKRSILPIPVDAELRETIENPAKATGLKQADVMRQGLRHGVPAFVRRIQEFTRQGPPVDFSFMDKYPKAKISAKDVKKALKEKLVKKYGRPNR
jgi:hypothetical protein